MDPQATEEGGHLLRPLRLLRQKSSSQPMKPRGKQMGAPNDSNKGMGGFPPRLSDHLLAGSWPPTEPSLDQRVSYSTLGKQGLGIRTLSLRDSGAATARTGGTGHPG